MTDACNKHIVNLGRVVSKVQYKALPELVSWGTADCISFVSNFLIFKIL